MRDVIITGICFLFGIYVGILAVSHRRPIASSPDRLPSEDE